MADALDEFSAAARQYCTWCEAPDGDTLNVFRLLSRLVVAIVEVPAADCGSGRTREITHEQWKETCERLRPMPFSYYKMPFDPHDLDAANDGLDDLFDDLADIWRDLKPGLELFDAGERGDAAKDWRFNFDIHWGRHATSALYALHCWMADHRASK
jgi:hypothetical protein